MRHIAKAAPLSLAVAACFAHADPASLEPVYATAGTNYQIQQQLSPETYERSSHIQETAPGLKSPYNGAFTGNQVDQTLNGIRMNNSLFRSGPNQYFSWVPSEFTTGVSLSDGGNVGGSINRTLGARDTSAGFSYNSANNGFSQNASYKGQMFEFAALNNDTGDLRTSDGTVPHSSYNQRALMANAFWNENNRTTIVYSESHDLDRTDKFNGGWRSTGYQAPSVYTWQLQQYLFANHELHYGGFGANLAYQDSTEHILDGTKLVRTNVKAYTANLSYAFNDNWSVYSTNTYEDIFYHNAVTADANDHYITTKQGVRYENDFGFAKLAASLGAKQVRVSDTDPFNTTEGSLILSRSGYFASFDRSSNAPGYAMLKQSTTSGKGTSVPNPSLREEQADTWRIGYSANGLYADVYYKRFTDALTSATIAKNTYKPVNGGGMDVYGSTLGYRNANVAGTGIGFAGRAEFTYGKADIYNSNLTEPVGKVPPYNLYAKADYKGYFAEWMYAPKDNLQSASDLDDVRIYAYNRGYNLANFGYGQTYKNIEYKATVFNAFNNNGRVLGSSANVPERSLILSMKYKF